MYNNIGVCFAKEDRDVFLEELITKLKDNPRAEISQLEFQSALYQNSPDRIKYSDFYALIMIVSKNNKDSSWVQHALRVVANQRPGTPHKIIPVIIDDCFMSGDPPGDQTINLFDHKNYSFELFNIKSLAGLHVAKYLNYNSFHPFFPNLSEFTNKLFMSICNQSVLLDYPVVSMPEILHTHNIPVSGTISDSILDLQAAGYIEQLRSVAIENQRYPDIIRVSSYGLNRYLQRFYRNYANLRKSIIEHILGNSSNSLRYALRSEIIAKNFREPKLIINTILEDLASTGKVLLERTYGENWEVSGLQHNMFNKIV